MNERVIRFGDDGRLVGILTEPNAPEPNGEGAGDGRDRPAMVLLGSGILHRVGASRLHVSLARALAREGITTLRFDFSGIGDSEVRRDRLSFRESAVLETIEAVDLLADRRDARGFVLGGLCSGADVAFWSALEDERVRGLIQLDGFAYPTPRFHVNRIMTRLTSPLTWPSWAWARTRGLLDWMWVPDSPPGGPTPVTSGYRRTFPPREETAAGLRSLNGRGVAFYLFFTGSHRPYLNYAAQYAEAFPEVDFEGRIRVDFVPEADHTITGLAHQRLVVERILSWTRTHWPRPESSPRPAGAPGALAPG